MVQILFFVIICATATCFGSIIGSQWIETFVSPNAAKEEEQNPLLRVEKCEEGCASNQEGSNDYRGRKKRKYFSISSMESLPQ